MFYQPRFYSLFLSMIFLVLLASACGIGIRSEFSFPSFPTPEEAARRAMIGSESLPDKFHTTYPQPDQALVVFRTDKETSIEVGFTLTRKGPQGWYSEVMQSSEYPIGDVPLLLNAHLTEPGSKLAFLHAVLFDEQVTAASATYADGETQPVLVQDRIPLLAFDLAHPVCQVDFLDASGQLVESVRLAETGSSKLISAVEPEVQQAVAEQCG